LEGLRIKNFDIFMTIWNTFGQLLFIAILSIMLSVVVGTIFVHFKQTAFAPNLRPLNLIQRLHHFNDISN
jgi:nucleoside recognition membrane protein YjiH